MMMETPTILAMACGLMMRLARVTLTVETLETRQMNTCDQGFRVNDQPDQKPLQKSCGGGL